MEQYDIVQKLMKLYCYYKGGYQYMYPVYEDGEMDGRYNTPGDPLQETDLYEHLDGKKTVCVRGGEFKTVFHCYDIDESSKEHVRLLIDRLAEIGIPRDRIYVSTSGNKGYHVEYFFDAPVFKSACEDMFDYARRNPAVANIKMECRPVNAQSIKIPLGINFRTGNRCWYVDRETLEPIESFDYIGEIRQISAEEFNALVFDCNKKRKTEDIEIAKAGAEKARAAKKEAAPEAKARTVRFTTKREPMMTQQGQRHEMMMRKAIWLRSIGAEEDEIYDGLMDWVDRQNQNLINSSRKEIEDDARNLTIYAMKHARVKSPRRQVVRFFRENEFTQEDLQIILREENKSTRKILTLIIAYCKVFGTCEMSLIDMADIIDVSKQTVQTIVNQLIDRCILIKERKGGMHYNVDKVPILRPNVYKMSANPMRDKKIKTDKKVPFRLCDVKSDFAQFYYGMLAAMIDLRTLKQRLTLSEYKIVREIAKNECSDY